MAIENLVSALQARAYSFAKSETNPEEHCLSVISLLKEMPFEELLGVESHFPKLDDNGIVRALHIEEDLTMTTMRLKKGECIHLHDHPNMTGVIFALAGQIQIDAYDVVEKPSDERESFVLRQGATGIIREGEAGHLTPSRGNVHRVEALEDTYLLDVFCPPYQGDHERKWFRRAEEPMENASEKGVFYEAELCDPQYVSVGAFSKECEESVK
ncbi:MAG: hypothetical protein GY822_09400 [Deltaproteobacteria bacterium]|nr:hypothetical protein [Deltaproteobacteria bacterium]